MPKFERKKFKELLLHLARNSADDPKFGAVKLNKLLYFSDFEAYRRLGHPITGARYQKLPWGPAAIEFLPLQDELLSEGLVKLEERQRGPHAQRVTVALAEPDLAVFSAEELQVIEEVLADLRPHGAIQVSELSHERSAGWNLVEIGEVIPYGSAFVSMRAPDRAIFRHAERLARERGWAELHP